jgi:hypothetical protein
VLEPIEGDTHPFPTEIDLPPWTVARDVDFRRWLFGYGEEVIIESPNTLIEAQITRSSTLVELLGQAEISRPV